MNYQSRFKSCGENVFVADDAFFEHPEVWEVGDNVRFMAGFYTMGAPQKVKIGSNVNFFPRCFIQGDCDLFQVENHVEFYPQTYISLGGKGSVTTIGGNSHFAVGCALYGGGGLTIGNHCNIAAHSVFATVQHDEKVLDRPMSQTSLAGPIILEDDVWIAANVTITKDTRIARGCVIGAGAVVTRDTKPMGVYVGVPARRLRDRDPGKGDESEVRGHRRKCS